MSIKMTKEQARQFAARWALVNAHERKELRATTPQRKFRQLRKSGRKFGFEPRMGD